MSGADDALRVTRSVVIPAHELQWRFSASGGPGGQHANTANTRVELVYDPTTSTALGPTQRARIIGRLRAPIRVVVSSERSQLQNRRIARERLAARLADALAVESPRRATRPTLGSEVRRLDAKKRQAERKSERGRRFSPDD